MNDLGCCTCTATKCGGWESCSRDIVFLMSDEKPPKRDRLRLHRQTLRRIADSQLALVNAAMSVVTHVTKCAVTCTETNNSEQGDC